MINVLIYLKQKHDSKQLVATLLTEKLIASASIDQNNVSYKLTDGLLSEEIYSVITAQSKSLLLNDIIKKVDELIGEEVPVNSIPIVGSNKAFDNSIRSKTLPT
jgi:uncharacterized protein involved in tolerance to divalent cations